MDVDSHDASKVIDVDELHQQFIRDYSNGNVNMATHPLMHRFCDSEFCDVNPCVEMAKVAAVVHASRQYAEVMRRLGKDVVLIFRRR